jgi:hypothetical protein
VSATCGAARFKNYNIIIETLMTGIKKIFGTLGRAGRLYAAVLACAAMAPIAVSGQEQWPAIKDIELMAGPRGLILTVVGTGPIALGGQADQLEKGTARYTQMRVTVTKARSALDANTFAPPESLPIKSIAASESPDGIALTIAMRGIVNGPVQIRSSGNQVRILLTKDALPEVVWSSSKGLVSGPAGAAPKLDVTIPSEGEIKTEPLDMKKLETRAVRDINSPINPPVFFVKNAASQAAAHETPPPQVTVPSQPPPAPAVPAPRIDIANPEVPRALPDDAPGQTHDSEPGKPASADNLVRYKAIGRDPFVPLVKDTSRLSELPRVENLRLVGVLEDTRERIALLEDFRDNNRAFALRVNDPVEYGKVLRVHRDKVVFLIRDFDVSRSYTLGISKDAQNRNARNR